MPGLSLRAQVSRLLGVIYTANRMSYDLGRLRRNGLIERIEGTNTYLPTTQGQRAAVFYTKIHGRLLRPLFAADTPPAPAELRAALRTIDNHVYDWPRAPETAKEGIKLRIGPENFNKQLSGTTLFQRDVD